MNREEIECWSPLKAGLYSLFYGSPKSNIAVVDFAELTGEDRFLDVGCGPGAALEHAAATGAEVAGIDPSPSMVARAARRVPTAHVQVGSAEEIPFPNDHFSVVVNISSFHHWSDREAGLSEILRILAPGGMLHIVEGALREGKDGHGLSPSDAQSVASKLQELGYVETDIERIKPGWRREYFVVTGKAGGEETPPERQA